MHLEITDQNAWHGAPRFAVTGEWASCHPAISDGVPTSSGIPLKFTGCKCGCGLGWLGDGSGLTSAQAMQAAISMYSGANLNPKDFKNPTWLSKAASQIAAGQFDLSWYPGNQCSGHASNMNLLTTATGISLSAAGATTGILVATHVISAVTGAVLGAATLGVGALISVVAMIFAHHAAAVARDVNFACSAMPAINNAFSVIAQAVKAGQTTPAAAVTALDSIYSQFMQAGGATGPSGIPDGGAAINKHPYCNANCEMSVILKGMVLYWQAIYNAMATPASTSAPAGSTPVPSSPGTVVPLNSSPAAALTSGSAAQPVASGPSWGLIAAGLVGAFLFFKMA